MDLDCARILNLRFCPSLVRNCLYEFELWQHGQPFNRYEEARSLISMMSNVIFHFCALMAVSLQASSHNCLRICGLSDSRKRGSGLHQEWLDWPPLQHRPYIQLVVRQVLQLGCGDDEI